MVRDEMVEVKVCTLWHDLTGGGKFLFAPVVVDVVAGDGQKPGEVFLVALGLVDFMDGCFKCLGG